MNKVLFPLIIDKGIIVFQRWRNRRETTHYGHTLWYRFRSAIGLLTRHELEREKIQLEIWQSARKRLFQDMFGFPPKEKKENIEKENIEKENLRLRSIFDDWEITQDSVE